MDRHASRSPAGNGNKAPPTWQGLLDIFDGFGWECRAASCYRAETPLMGSPHPTETLVFCLRCRTTACISGVGRMRPAGAIEALRLGDVHTVHLQTLAPANLAHLDR